MTRRKVLWARSARRDLESIVSWLADRSPQAALSTLDRLEARAKSIVTLDDRGRIVPELGRLQIQQYREIVVPPHRLIYRIRATSVLVLVVVDARRSLEDALLERLIWVKYGNQANGKIATQTLSIKPYVNPNGDLVGVCGRATAPAGSVEDDSTGTASGAVQTTDDLLDKYLPAVCRTGAVAAP